MKTKTKVVTSIIALILSCVLLFTVVVLNNDTNKTQVTASSRTIELSQSALDVQSVFDEFKDATLTREGDTVYFEGYKSLDSSALTELDYISDVDFEELENCTVKYNFSYNSETNVVTLSAIATLEDGTVEVDEITGVGFINEQNEIDAVMNIDGEGILLSEMRDAGLIQNCGWLKRLIKTVAKVVAITATVVAVGALVVATAGMAAPAFVAATFGFSTTAVIGAAATATTIAGYATITAALAAGVYISADTWEKSYPGINVKMEGNIAYAETYDKAEKAIKDIVKANRNKSSNPEIYFECGSNSDFPNRINMTPMSRDKMARKMRTYGTSSVTYYKNDAYNVIRQGLSSYPIFQDVTRGLNHYHGCDIKNKNYSPYRSYVNNPRVVINTYTVHSFWSE